MKLRPSDLAVIAAMALMTLIAGNEILGRVLDDGPQTSPAIITEPTPRTVVIAPVESTAVSTTSTTPATSTTTAHDALQADLAIPILDPSVPCQQWAPLALKIGWPEDELVNVLEEMWQESRCLNIIPGTDQWNGGDHGLMQINTVWKDEVEHLFGSWERINDPEVNLAMALEIWRWHDAHRGCGWEPWSRPC
jgi:hypothetical protein